MHSRIKQRLCLAQEDVVRRVTGSGLPEARVWWWRDIPNFGDLLSPALVQRHLLLRPTFSNEPGRGRLLAIGSIARRARPNDLVFGSGLMREVEFVATGVKFLAVRGPLTRNLIRDADVPAVYGDPAILLPRFYRPRRIQRAAVGIIPHYSDQDIMRRDDPQIRNIDVTSRNWKKTVDKITSCDVVLSSSLHGIVVAEAYGVPAVWVRASDRVRGDGFKFRDYYASANRDTEPQEWSTGLAALLSSAAPAPLPDADQLAVSALKVRQAIEDLADAAQR